jgi:hypothetical protein
MGAIIKFKSYFCSEPWKRDPDFVHSLLLTPTAITLQFQGGVDSAIGRNAAFGICARAVVAKLVRCQGRHEESMSLAQQLERSG